MTMAVLLVVAACTTGTAATPNSSSGHTPAATSPSHTPSTTVSPVDAATQAALAAYQGMWADFAAAGTTSDWRSPRLSQHATAYALSTMSRGLYADHYNGLVSRGAPVLHPNVSSVDPPANPTKVIIADCGDDTHWLKYRANNGQLADNTPGGHRLINAVVQKQPDGSWKVTDFGVHDEGTC
ncbi:MAG TPA: hypothetical protein VEO01_25105 [Pseudonocardiaceae bacterium]|nr:hypothetical protein [Pseudonocardiaceae bacterium]